MKMAGGIILFLGLVLSFFGYNQMNSLEAKLGQMFGQADNTGMIMVGAGIVIAIVGIILLLKKSNNEKA